MPLRIGVAVAVLCALLAGGVAVIFALGSSPPEKVSALRSVVSGGTREPAARPAPSPEPRHEKGEPRAGGRPQPGKFDPESGAKESEPRPRRAPEPEPRSRPRPEPEAQPVAERDEWPAPDRGELKETREVRRYRLPDGAIMGLTIRSLEFYNAPVISSNNRRALEAGAIHVPETSLPWTRAPQRNVYLAGHRLGYPGTGSRLIFYKLDELRRGDEIVLHDRRGRAYRYRVSERFAVSPYDSWVMGQVRGRDMLTLQTCTGPDFERRLIIRADRT